MVSWSARRQLVYVSGALALFVFVLALPIFFVSYSAPSCADGKQNQGEFGIDCGGPCRVLCKANALDMIIHWQRAFKVKSGVYNAVAYIENPNLDSGIPSISYRFKFYDKDNLLIYERTGTTFVPPQKIFGIFESNIFTGARVPARTFFEFSSAVRWQKSDVGEPPISFQSTQLSDQNALPRLSAILQNRGLNPVYDIEVVALVYDADGNAVGASRTIVDRADAGVKVPLTFTWPEAFAAPVLRAELIYRVLR